MISTLQPSRPKTQPPRSQNPLHQQQTRPVYTRAHPPPPSNQIEAMPPNTTNSSRPAVIQPAPAPMYNPATMHPVFFTESWRRPPFSMPFNNGFSPAATGYVFGEARKRSPSMTKL